MGRANTLTVTSTADSGPGTLRAALASAGNGDIVDATGVSGTIMLTAGELLVDKSVAIRGPGPASLAVNGDAASRVFHISANTVVSISGLTITNGFALGPDFPADRGGGILNDQATLTVMNCTFSGNSSSNSDYVIGVDVGICNRGTITVTNSTVSANSSGHQDRAVNFLAGL